MPSTQERMASVLAGRAMKLLVSLLSVAGSLPASHATAQVAYTVFAVKPSQTARDIGPRTQQDTPTVTLVLRDSTLEYVIGALARQAHLQPVYPTTPAMAKRINVHVVKVRVMDAFAVVLRGTGLHVTLAPDSETVMIRRQREASTGEQGRQTGGTVTGRVTDSASGRGLAGATVKIEGTTLSTVTSDSGHFTLQDVPVGEHVINVRLFGYRAALQTVTVADSERTTVRFALVSIPTALSQVVTTATGTQRKVEIGNDITSINVDSVMRVAPITSVTDLLENRVPGLTVQHSSGVPGDPSRLRLRGAGSIQLSNDPVVIVDGIRVYASQSDTRNRNLAPTFFNSVANAVAAPSPLDQIDPNSIATVEVFKGPSASALYGSDAANGVIVITTKHGRAGPTHWGVALGMGVNWLPGGWPDNYYRFGTDERNGRFGLCSWADRFCQVDSIVPYQALNDPRSTVFSQGHDQTASLTVSGGVTTLQYSLSASTASSVGYLKLPSIERARYTETYGSIPHALLRPDNYQTWGVNGSLTAQPSATVRVTLQSSLFNSVQQRSSLEGAITQLGGEYISTQDSVYGALGTSPFSLVNTPLIVNDVERATATSLNSTNTLALNWQPASWLPITAAAGLNTIQRTDVNYIPYGVGSRGPICGADTTGDCSRTGYYGLGRGTSHDQTISAGTAIPFLRQHVTVALGGQVYDESTADITTSTTQLAPGVSVPFIFACPPDAGDCQNTSQSTSGTSTYGWYLEPRLNLASRFFAAPGFRLDGGSGGAHSQGSIGGLSAFPKIDLSYVAVDRQNDRPLWGVLTLLRPRFAFGFAGTQPGPEARLRLLENSFSVVPLSDSTTFSLVNISSFGNTQLRPERSTELEGGFDATLWQGRLSLTYTQYRKIRRDAILDIPIAPSAGAGYHEPFYSVFSGATIKKEYW